MTCNPYTNEHNFVWAGSSSVSKPDPNIMCQCRKLSWKQAQELAQKALLEAEERRRKEREAESEYYKDLTE